MDAFKISVSLTRTQDVASGLLLACLGVGVGEGWVYKDLKSFVKYEVFIR